MSKNYVSVAKIKRDDFLKLVKFNQEDLEIFHKIKDDMIYQNNYKQVNFKWCGGGLF